VNRNKLWASFATVALIGTLAACGNESDNSSSSGDGGGDTATGAAWILGTTDPVTAVDPAGSYDFGSWNIQYNIFQQLMTVPANGSDPEPDLATSCAYDDPQSITCKLPADAKFSNGDPLTSARSATVTPTTRPWPTARSRRPTTPRSCSTSTSPTRRSCRS
jgi:peptide/nickel transport system substrate-binding protein